MELYDQNRDMTLSLEELQSFLAANGISVSMDQAKRWFQPVDDENDGFDAGEVTPRLGS